MGHPSAESAKHLPRGTGIHGAIPYTEQPATIHITGEGWHSPFRAPNQLLPRTEASDACLLR